MSTTLQFPAAITKIDGQPTLKTLTTLRAQLYANAISVQSNNGGGDKGHLGVIMQAAEYQALPFPGGNRPAWQDPAHPGNEPNYHGTAAVIANAKAAYERAKEEFTLFMDVERNLKQQVLSAVGPTYVNALADPLFGHANVSSRDILHHLMTTYGKLTEEDVIKNLATLDEPWNPDTPIADLWTRVSMAQAFAATSTSPITDDVALIRTYAVLRKSGVFEMAIEQWAEKTAADKTWANFKTFFSDKDTVRRNRPTTGQAGYNAFSITPAPSHDSNGSQDEANAAKSQGVTMTPNGRRLYYCWSHGLGTNRAHTSKTCRNKKEGHQDDATIDNMMGGNATIMKPRNQRNGANSVDSSSSDE